MGAFLCGEPRDSEPPEVPVGSDKILTSKSPKILNEDNVSKDEEKKDNLKQDFIVSTAVDIKEATAFVCNVVGEHHPILLQTGLSLEQRVECLRRAFPEHSMKNAMGLSTVAWKGGSIVGALLTMDWKDSQGIAFGEDMGEFEKMWGMCDKMWADSKGGDENIKANEWAHLVGLAVDPKFIGGCVPTKLLSESLTHLEKKGYRGAVLETNCSLDHSLAESVGFKKFVSVNYKRYRDETGKASFAALKRPHTNFSVWEIKLDSWTPEDFEEKE